MEFLLNEFCDGYFEQPILHDKHLSSGYRLPHLAATVLRRRQMEVLTDYYCHRRLLGSITASMSSTEVFGSSKPPLIVHTRPRMILFPIFSRFRPSYKVRLCQSVVDAPGLFSICILHHVFPPMSLEDRTFFGNFLLARYFAAPTGVLPNQDQVKIGSLIMDLNKTEGELAFMLGNHYANYELPVIQDTYDFSASSEIQTMLWPGKIGPKLPRVQFTTTTKRERVQFIRNPSILWTDFLSNVVQFQSKRKTTEILDGLSEGRTFYLITGHRTYLDPKLEVWDATEPLSERLRRIPRLEAGGLQLLDYQWAGSKLVALQLCPINVHDGPDHSQVGEPKWYVLWGPYLRHEERWPPKPVRPTR